jgi:adenylate cyclase class 2
MVEIQFKYQLPGGEEGESIVDKLNTLTIASRQLEQDVHGTIGDKYVTYRESFNVDSSTVTRHLIYKRTELGSTVQEERSKDIIISISELDAKKTVDFVTSVCEQILPTITKQRVCYRVQEYVITLDIIKELGVFVQVETVTESASGIFALKKLAEALGLKSDWLTKGESYSTLLQRKLNIV